MAIYDNVPGVNNPFPHSALVTPDDDNDLTNPTRGLSIAGAGAIKVTMIGGETVVIPSGALAAGHVHRIRVARVWNASTTATGITAWW